MSKQSPGIGASTRCRWSATVLKASRSSISGSQPRRTCCGWCFPDNCAPGCQPNSPTTCGCTARDCLFSDGVEELASQHSIEGTQSGQGDVPGKPRKDGGASQRTSLTEYWTGFWSVSQVLGHDRPAFQRIEWLPSRLPGTSKKVARSAGRMKTFSHYHSSLPLKSQNENC